MFDREIDTLYIHELLRTFAMTLVGVFIPIYIVSQGFSLLHAGLFIALSGLTGILFSYPLARIVARLGFRHGITASYLLVIPGILLIRSFNLGLWLIVASSMLYNVGRVMHNVAMNAEFATDSRHGSRSRDSGKMLSIPSIARIVGPFIGGMIYAAFGYTTLAATAIGILIVAIIPLLHSPDHSTSLDHSFRAIALHEHWRSIPLFTIRGIQAVSAVSIFGLFVYTFLGGTVDVGGARALDSLGFVATGLIASRLAERYGKTTVLTVGTLGAAALHLVRGMLAAPLQAFALSFLAGIFFQIYHVPLYAWFADRAEQHDALAFYTLRKIFVSLGNVLTVATLATGLYLVDRRAAFTATFVLAGASTLFMGYWFHNVVGFDRNNA